MSKASVASSLFDGVYMNPTDINMDTVTFKYDCKPVKSAAGVKQHTWKVETAVQKGEEYEQKSISFCLADPVTMSGLSIRSNNPMLITRIDQDPLLIDRISNGESIGEEDIGITVACFLDETKPSHKAFIEFGEKIVEGLKDFVKKRPDKNLPKPQEISFHNVVRQSRTSKRYYFVLRLSTRRQLEDKQLRTFPATGFYLNGSLRPIPWSHLYRSQFEGYFFFKLSHYSMTNKDAMPTMYATSCRRVDKVTAIVPSADRRQMEMMKLLGETPTQELPTVDPATDESESKEESSIEPDGDIHTLS